MKPSTYTTLSLAVVWSIAGTLLVLAFSSAQGCAGAPRTVEQISTMTDAEWEAYLSRVSVWSEAAGYTVVKERPEDFDRVVLFSTILASITAAPGSDPLNDAADQVQWPSPVSKLVLMEIRSLLEARGGIPAGERGQALLYTIAQGVQTGALSAATEPE